MPVLFNCLVSSNRQNNWKRAVTINAEDGGLCQYGARAIYDAFNSRKSEGYILAEWIRTDNVMKEEDLTRYVERIQQSGRSRFRVWPLNFSHLSFLIT